ncbi:MAG: hypothetical protein ACPL1K_03020, partial [Candidatus Kryptoniota bacterium]
MFPDAVSNRHTVGYVAQLRNNSFFPVALSFCSLTTFAVTIRGAVGSRNTHVLLMIDGVPQFMGLF